MTVSYVGMLLQNHPIQFPRQIEKQKKRIPRTLTTFISFVCPGDYFGNPDDVAVLRKSLRSIVWDYTVPDDHFVHLDFVFGIDARQLIYDPLVSFMEKLRLADLHENHVGSALMGE